MVRGGGEKSGEEAGVCYLESWEIGSKRDEKVVSIDVISGRFDERVGFEISRRETTGEDRVFGDHVVISGWVVLLFLSSGAHRQSDLIFHRVRFSRVRSSLL